MNVKQSQRKMLNSILDLWESKIIPRSALAKGIGAIFETTEAGALKPIVRQGTGDGGRSGGCTERLVAA